MCEKLKIGRPWLSHTVVWACGERVCLDQKCVDFGPKRSKSEWCHDGENARISCHMTGGTYSRASESCTAKKV